MNKDLEFVIAKKDLDKLKAEIEQYKSLLTNAVLNSYFVGPVSISLIGNDNYGNVIYRTIDLV